MSEGRPIDQFLDEALRALNRLQEVANASDREEILGIRRWLWETLGMEKEPLTNAPKKPRKDAFEARGNSALRDLGLLRDAMELDHGKKTLADMHDWLHQILGKGTQALPNLEKDRDVTDGEPYIIINENGRREVDSTGLAL